MRPILIAFLLVLIPSLAFAQGIPEGAMDYKATQSHKKNAKIVKDGIENAIEDMSFITRPIARSRLKDSNLPFKTIKVVVKGDKVTIQHDKRKVITSPVSGAAIQWKREDGEVFKVTQAVKPKLIVQTFYSEDGNKVLKYYFSEDYKKLTVNIVLKSPKLSGPLKYKLTYALQ